jgi:isoaspartyl peptidase/L-asparaginase-like protein (Ntn-hydrolase superfamily)
VSPGALLVHAGAGVWPERLEAAAEACRGAVAAGVALLKRNGRAVDAAIAAVVVLEDDPNCDAGTGAVPTSAGTVDLDAAVIDGHSVTSGAVTCLQGYRHPILVAEEIRGEGRWYRRPWLGPSSGSWCSPTPRTGMETVSNPRSFGDLPAYRGGSPGDKLR